MFLVFETEGGLGDTPEPRTRGGAPCISPIFHAAAKVLRVNLSLQQIQISQNILQRKETAW